MTLHHCIKALDIQFCFFFFFCFFVCKTSVWYVQTTKSTDQTAHMYKADQHYSCLLTEKYEKSADGSVLPAQC